MLCTLCMLCTPWWRLARGSRAGRGVSCGSAAGVHGCRQALATKMDAWAHAGLGCPHLMPMLNATPACMGGGAAGLVDGRSRGEGGAGRLDKHHSCRMFAAPAKHASQGSRRRPAAALAVGAAAKQRGASGGRRGLTQCSQRVKGAGAGDPHGVGQRSVVEGHIGVEYGAVQPAVLQRGSRLSRGVPQVVTQQKVHEG